MVGLETGWKKNLKDEVEKHDDYEGNTQQPHNDRGHLEDSI